MATHSNSTLSGAYETQFTAGYTQVHTPVTRAFSLLLMQFPDMIAAETRLEMPDPDVCSAAFVADLRRADLTRDALIEAACDVIVTDAVNEEDRALHRIATLLVTLFQLDDSIERKLLLAQTLKHRDVFDIRGMSPVARHARGMQIAFFRQFDVLAGLREFGGPGLALEQGAVMADVADPIPA